jgi:dipeptidase E
MSKLLLASSGSFITSQKELFGKKLTAYNIAYIVTASKKVHDLSYINKHRHRMDALGWRYTEIDIDGKSEAELTSLLQPFDLIYVEGGNTFFLLKKIRESGFENIVKRSLQQGKIYAGASAGAYVACPSIIMATWSAQNFDRCGVTDLAGMHLVDFLIKAHYTPEEDERLRRLWDQEKNLHRYPLYLLDDALAVVVEDKKVRIVGGEGNIWK